MFVNFVGKSFRTEKYVDAQAASRQPQHRHSRHPVQHRQQRIR